MATARKAWRIGILALAFSVFAVLSLCPPMEGLDVQGQRAIAIFLLCIVLWATHVIPLMITSLMAIVLFPLMRVMDAKTTFSLFGNEAVFFILGAFILASSLMRCGLSSRIALLFLNRFGRSPRSLLASIVCFSAFMSLWMTEHAVAAMVFPIVFEIVTALRLEPKRSPYAKSLFLAMAWGAIVGGVGTFLGGARAPLAVGLLREVTGETIGFVSWAMAAFPLVLALAAAAIPLLLRLFPSERDSIQEAKAVLEEKLKQRGSMTRKEKAVGVLMLLTILCWSALGHTLGLANIALVAVILGFVFNLMDWKNVEEDVNWGIFLMYGGAISLGFAMNETGASSWLAERLFSSLPACPWVALLALSCIALFLSEGVSNAAVVAMLMPVGLGLANGFGLDSRTVTLAVTLPAGLPFMMPMGTPATAIAYSSGHLVPRDTLIGGFLMDVAALLVVNAIAAFYWPLIGFHP